MKRIDYSRKPDLFSLKEREEKNQATETHEKWAAKYKENKIKRERKNAEDYQIHGLILDVFKAHRAVPFHGDRRFSVSPQVRERERENSEKRRRGRRRRRKGRRTGKRCTERYYTPSSLYS